MRQILLAGEESNEGAALLSDVVAEGPAQHGIRGFKRVEHGPLRDRTFDFEQNIAANPRQRAQMARKYSPDHDSVCTSTESTAGRSRTIGAQLSPASADA